MIRTQHRNVRIQFHNKSLNSIQRIMKSMNHMSLRSQKYDILDILSLGMYFQNISSKIWSRITLISYNKLIFLDDHLHNLTTYRRIIKISSKQKENQNCSHNVIINDGKHEYTRNNNSEYQISWFAFFEFFSIINKNAHDIYNKINIWKFIVNRWTFSS